MEAKPVGVLVANHPAQFTDSIIQELGVLIPAHLPSPSHAVYDPFAGVGVRLGALCDRLGVEFSGGDLEEWPGADPRVAARADATAAWTYPRRPFVVVTSPTYNNGVNDHFRPRDASRRLTYRSRLGRELHPNNTGRYSGRSSKAGEVAYWRLTREAVKHWPDTVLVNVKDSIRAGEVYPLVEMWSDCLGSEFGYEVSHHPVGCPGWRFGSNSGERVEAEVILVGQR